MIATQPNPDRLAPGDAARAPDTPAPASHIPAPQDRAFTPSPPSPLSPLSPLSPSDLSLLSSLFSPSANPASVAAAHNLSHPDLALWFTRPDIQAAYQAMLALDDHFRRHWAEQHLRAAIQTLAEIQQSSDSLIERRRAATDTLRALRSGSLSRAPRQTESSRVGERATSSTPAPGPVTPVAPVAPVTPVTRGTHASIHPLTPSSPKDSPDFIPDYVINRLRKLRKRTPAAALMEISGVTRAPTLATHDGALAFSANLERLLDALDGATIEPGPATVDPDNRHARKLYTVRAPDGSARQFLLGLSSDPGSTNWWLQDIIPLDTT